MCSERATVDVSRSVLFIFNFSQFRYYYRLWKLSTGSSVDEDELFLGYQRVSLCFLDGT